MCLRGLKESNKSKFDSYSATKNSVLIISHITFRDCHVHIFLTFLVIAVYIVVSQRTDTCMWFSLF